MSIIKCTLILCAAIAATQGFALGPRQIIFYLFKRGDLTRNEPLFPTRASIMASSFSLTSRTIITIHDNGEAVNGNFNAFVVRALLDAEDVNVLAVDWSAGSTTSYPFSVSNTPQVGNVVAQFVNILKNDFGYDPANVRIVGVGLGAHAAGIAARKIDGNVPHIFALDPALIGWSHHPDKLNKNDAGIVEVIHTSSGFYGYDTPLGDLDFYSNGGFAQPTCGTNVTCSHQYAYIFYAESLTADLNNGNKFVGTACETYEQAVNLQCTGARDSIFGGSAIKTSGSGIYSFTTNDRPPFARG